jgi:hypothetical protein
MSSEEGIETEEVVVGEHLKEAVEEAEVVPEVVVEEQVEVVDLNNKMEWMI